MAETATQLPVKREGKSDAPATQGKPFANLRHAIDRLLDDFDGGFFSPGFRRSMFDLEPSWYRESTWITAPAVDITESEKAYEITAELPGLEEKDIEVKLANGGLTISGERRAEKEEKKKDYYLHERSFGSFERRFRMPDGVDTDKIDASFKKGVLTVTLPKSPEAQNAEKKIAVKAA